MEIVRNGESRVCEIAS